jgi:hypothetical protein
VHSHIQDHCDYENVGEPWSSILYRKFIFFDKRMVDEYDPDWLIQRSQLSKLFRSGDYLQVYGCLDYFLNDPQCPSGFDDLIQQTLKHQGAPYLVDNNMLVPVATAEQGGLLLEALEQLRNAPMAGASQHLKHAIQFLNAGQWAKSVAESIHAVESVARKIEPSGKTLDPALKKLAPKINMHPALKERSASSMATRATSRGFATPSLRSRRRRLIAMMPSSC